MSEVRYKDKCFFFLYEEDRIVILNLEYISSFYLIYKVVGERLVIV